MNMAERLREQNEKTYNAWEHKGIFLAAIEDWFTNNRGSALAIKSNPPRIDSGHIREKETEEGVRYYSQKKKKYPYKFNYPYDEHIIDKDVTGDKPTYLRYYSEEDMQRKAEILRQEGFRTEIRWVRGSGTLLLVSL